MSTEACVVVSTTSSHEDAEKIAKAVLTARLAACVQIFPMTSYYWWNDEIQNDAEHIMLFKARDEDYHLLELRIKEVHSYDTPEIIKLPVSSVAEGYHAWLIKETMKG